jgi:hypothetical protein
MASSVQHGMLFAVCRIGMRIGKPWRSRIAAAISMDVIGT